jgi:hypothetical protein
MKDVVKMWLCFAVSIVWATGFSAWGPQTPMWLAVAVIPSLVLGLLGIVVAIKLRYPGLFRR